MILLGALTPRSARGGATDMKLDHPPAADDGAAGDRGAHLVKRFGDFVRSTMSTSRCAAARFRAPRAYGAGKTTTFRMLCGLLTAERRRAQIAGTELAQPGSGAPEDRLCGAEVLALRPLSVTENLDFFASAYGLHGARRASGSTGPWPSSSLGP